MSNWMSDKELLQLMTQLEHGAERPDSSPADGGGESLPCAWLEVRNGKIVIVESGTDGPYPTIEPHPPLLLSVNGIPIAAKTEIRPGDTIEWTVNQPPLYRIDISPDRMKAWFVLHALERFDPRLPDHPLTDHLVLKAEEDRSRITERIHYEDILAKISDLRLPWFDSKAIFLELHCPSYVPITIAAGKEPVNGRDASLELFFKENIESSYEETNGVVDYRNHLKIPSVAKGDKILRKIPSVPGEAGYDVFGARLEPPAPKDIILIEKQHVVLTPDHEAFATKEGRPRVTGDRIKFIDITTTHVVYGNVDMKTGNIVFSGDVIVYGDVMDGMIVEALGDVHIMGNLYRSTVTATGSVHIKGNAVGGKLYSGHYGVLFNRLYDCSVRLNEKFASLRSMAKQLLQVAGAKKKAVTDKQVFQLLIDTKYKDIPDVVKDILGCIANIQSINKNQLIDLKDKLSIFAQPNRYSQIHIGESIRKVQPLLIETIESIRRCEEKHVVTEINQCHLSEIMSNGDIVVRKQGVLQSKLYSQGNISFIERGSVCRGSTLEALGKISVMIVGGQSGGNTMLKAGEQIEADLIYEGRVVVDRFAVDILEPIEHIRYFVQDNHLMSITTAQREGNHVCEIG